MRCKNKRNVLKHKKYRQGNNETKKQVLDIIKSTECVKLHIGCGTVYKNNWINIDNNNDKNIEKLDINWDLRHPLPFLDNSVDFIYNEHFLEHLTIDEGQAFLKDCQRVLKTSAIMRIAMPDLKAIINAYLNLNYFEDNKVYIKKYGLGFVKTRAEMLNIDFRWWGHQHLYDEEELVRRLSEVGFAQIEICEIHKSRHKELCNMETREQSTLIVEAIKQDVL